jgi:hypothetical protein
VSGVTTRTILELRPLPWIALGYVLAPLVGLGLVLATDLQLWRSGSSGLRPALMALASGWVVGLVLELIIVSPLLVAFHRYRWPWVNGWTGAAFGFVLGGSSWLLLVGGLLGGLAPAEVEGGVQALRIETLAETATRAVRAMAMFSASGLVSAVVFRSVAVRSVGDPQR